MKKRYYIGGSPCAGKSTVAELLAKGCGLTYFKVDDFLEKYMEQGAAEGRPACQRAAQMSAEQTWMRAPEIQCQEEFEIYEEIFEYILADLDRIDGENGIITEGAAYVPALMKKLGIPGDSYLAITPAADFQVSHYRQRPFVPYVLEGCRDKERAFRNWMDRDILFAREVRRQCGEAGFASILNDGSLSIEAMVDAAVSHFGFLPFSF